jgi:hypothetical protein
MADPASFSFGFFGVVWTLQIRPRRRRQVWTVLERHGDRGAWDVPSFWVGQEDEGVAGRL